MEYFTKTTKRQIVENKDFTPEIPPGGRGIVQSSGYNKDRGPALVEAVKQ